jgi:hypothetical protein
VPSIVVLKPPMVSRRSNVQRTWSGDWANGADTITAKESSAVRFRVRDLFIERYPS